MPRGSGRWRWTLPCGATTRLKADDGFWKLPVAIISNGNTVKNTEYSFLANVLAARGYLVASIQQDIPTDPPLMTKVGLPYVGRRGVYEKGEANILFVIGQLQQLQPNADYHHLTLVGHSNGGDISMYFAKHHPELVSKVITLDNLRVPFVLSDKMKILSFRSKRPEFQDRSRRAAECPASQKGRHRYRQYQIPAHPNERPRPGIRSRRRSRRRLISFSTVAAPAANSRRRKPTSRSLPNMERALIHSPVERTEQRIAGSAPHDGRPLAWPSGPAGVPAAAIFEFGRRL